MQKPDESKRREIKAVAARLFAERPFHEVKLEDVAAQARVGKGTLYVYFAGKDQLYAAVVAEGMAALVDDVRARIAETSDSAWAELAAIVSALVAFSGRFPHLFTLMRSGHPIAVVRELTAERERLVDLIEEVVRRGAARGELADSHPELTALYVPALVRAVLLYGPTDLQPDLITRHILELLRHGLAVAPANPTRCP